MARTSRNTSSEQKNEAQRDEATTSADSTSMISGTRTATNRPSAEEEQAEIQKQADAMSGKEPENDAAEKISVKTLGPYMLQDPTTGDIVEQKGSEVIKTSWIVDQLEAGRIEKA